MRRLLLFCSNDRAVVHILGRGEKCISQTRSTTKYPNNPDTYERFDYKGSIIYGEYKSECKQQFHGSFNVDFGAIK